MNKTKLNNVYLYRLNATFILSTVNIITRSSMPLGTGFLFGSSQPFNYQSDYIETKQLKEVVLLIRSTFTNLITLLFLKNVCSAHPATHDLKPDNKVLMKVIGGR